MNESGCRKFKKSELRRNISKIKEERLTHLEKTLIREMTQMLEKINLIVTTLAPEANQGEAVDEGNVNA